MAITGPIYWNGTTFPSQDGDPIAITQTEFEDCCCGGSPCDDCSGTQLAAEVSLDACTPTPTIDTGSFTFFLYEDNGGGSCTWAWTKGDTTLFVDWTGGSYLIALSGDNEDYYGGGVSVLTCVSGNLTGTVEIYDPINDCYGEVEFG